MGMLTIRYVFKRIELLLSIVCMTLYAKSIINSNEVFYTVLPIVYGGYIILLLGVLVGDLANEQIQFKTDLFYSSLGFLLFIIAGSIGITYFQPGSVNSAIPKKLQHNEAYMRRGLETGILATINAVVFLVDIVCLCLENMGTSKPNTEEVVME